MKLCYIDLETSGTDFCKHAILQIAGRIECEGKEPFEFVFPVKPFPDDELDPVALQMHGEKFKDGLEPRDLRLKLLSIFGRFVDKYDKKDKFFFVGYNAKFDYDFLRKFFEKCGDKYFGSWFWFPPICVMQLAGFELMSKRQEMENFKLGTVCRKYGLEFSDDAAHEAMYDVKKTVELYETVRFNLRDSE